jgi:hypothetical protein
MVQLQLMQGERALGEPGVDEQDQDEARSEQERDQEHKWRSRGRGALLRYS